MEWNGIYGGFMPWLETEIWDSPIMCLTDNVFGITQQKENEIIIK